MKIFQFYTSLITQAVQHCFGDKLQEIPYFSVEAPQNRQHGDIATNVALVIARKMGAKPLEVAARLVEALRTAEKSLSYSKSESHSDGVIQAKTLNNQDDQKISLPRHKDDRSSPYNKADLEAWWSDAGLPPQKHRAACTYLKNAEFVAPGFINLQLHDAIWHNLVENINCSDYSTSTLGNGEHINIEFVSANPTGPMHIGHARGGVYGDAIARILGKCGFKVIKEYYINDAGKQVDILGKSLFIRYQQLCGLDAIIPEGCYPGEYLIPIAEKLLTQHGHTLLSMDPEPRHSICKEMALTEIMMLIKKDLSDLGVEHDVFISEQRDIIDLGMVEETLDTLKAKGLIYQGTLAPPKGKVLEDWEPTVQTIFRATTFGDSFDRPVLRNDGSYTYFASDIALHYHKIKSGARKMLLLLGADHSGYTERLKAAVKALADDKASLEILIVQMVRLLKGKEVLKMSKRSGNFLSLQEMIADLGKGIVRFAMLNRKSDTVFDLDFAQVKEQSKDNPIFYIQYAHTRAFSVLDMGIRASIIQPGEFNIILADDNKCSLSPYLHTANYHYNPTSAPDYTLLTHSSEIALIQQLALYPKALESAAIHYEPHRIAYYLYNLATSFHNLWHQGTVEHSLRVVVPEQTELSRARLGLAFATAKVIGLGLEVLGIEAVCKM